MTRFLWPGALAIAALALGVWMAPGAWEQAFMKMRDHDFPAATAAFETKFLNGDRRREVLAPLAELYVRDGRVDKAIDVLTQYAALNPQDLDVAKRLAALLREAQMMPQAIARLEQIATATGEPAAFRELDRLHDIAQDSGGRVRALSRLVKTGAATREEHHTLTNLLAASDAKLDALTVAYNAMRRWPADAPQGLVQTFAALAVDTKRPDMIDGALTDWARGEAKAPRIRAVVATLLDKGERGRAKAIAAASKAAVNGDPDAIVLLARIEADHGDRNRALDLLGKLAAAGKLPTASEADFAMLALALKRKDAAFARIAKRGPAPYPDAVLLQAVATAAMPGDAEWLAGLDKALTSGPARPLSLARVALARGDAARASTLADDARKTMSGLGAAVGLSQLYLDLNRPDDAKTLFEAHAGDGSAIGRAELGMAASVAVAIRNHALSLALSERLFAADKGPDATIVRARALTLSGDPKAALALLDGLTAASEARDFARIEALSAAGRSKELQDLVVAKLNDPGTVEPGRTNFIFLLNDLKSTLGPAVRALAPALTADLSAKSTTGPARDARLSLLAKIAPVAALPFLKTAAEADPAKAGYVYVDALKALKKTAELTRYLAFAAKNAKSQKTRDDYLQEWLKHAPGAEVLPLLAERARTDGLAWFYAYDEALKKYGSRDQRLEALSAFAGQSGLTSEFRRQIAFQILELGGKPAAEALFRGLAASAPPDSPDVRQLTFLWGPRPNVEARAWLAARAANAPQSEKIDWAKIQLNVGDTGAARATVRGVLASGEPEAAAILAEIYAASAAKDDLRQLLRDQSVNTASPAIAQRLAAAAESAGLNADASRLYETAAAKTPKSMAAAGRTAFYAGDAERAERLLSAAPGGDGETQFFLGEARQAQKKSAAANYRKALELLRDDAASRRLRMIALTRLKDFAGAERELAHADDAAQDAASDYAGALLDQGDVARAAKVLGQ